MTRWAKCLAGQCVFWYRARPGLCAAWPPGVGVPWAVRGRK
ncbi:hypothetical protein HMPREF1978_01896 [Actinomyces graevenitzii F0530]|uniref:Uncharacterized protein n=1 Tax=Actinomyces graevenitzii F0530 TaxID=1321817 RepID=U1PBP2_9ACTO|nr:hypothetical protein HMPREF1978_01896 [Actinomyces graevenitzii F0530]